MEEVSMFLAFGAGFLSFISPCVLPLFPVFLSYITCMSVSELYEVNKKLTKKAVFHTVLFLLGFSSVFVMIGVTTALVSDLFTMYKEIIRQVGAILIVFFGLVIVGVLNFDFLMKDRKINFKYRPTGFIGSFFVGMAFSMGWTPCTGPILMVVLSLAAQQPEKGMLLMMSYVLGFAIPFLVLSFFVGKMKWIKKHSMKLVKVGGYVMIVFGVALFFNWMTKLTSLLAEWTGFYGF